MVSDIQWLASVFMTLRTFPHFVMLLPGSGMDSRLPLNLLLKWKECGTSTLPRKGHSPKGKGGQKSENQLKWVTQTGLKRFTAQMGKRCSWERYRLDISQSIWELVWRLPGGIVTTSQIWRNRLCALCWTFWTFCFGRIQCCLAPWEPITDPSSEARWW